MQLWHHKRDKGKLLDQVKLRFTKLGQIKIDLTFEILIQLDFEIVEQWNMISVAIVCVIGYIARILIVVGNILPILGSIQHVFGLDLHSWLDGRGGVCDQDDCKKWKTCFISGQRRHS